MHLVSLSHLLYGVLLMAIFIFTRKDFYITGKVIYFSIPVIIISIALAINYEELKDLIYLYL